MPPSLEIQSTPYMAIMEEVGTYMYMAVSIAVTCKLLFYTEVLKSQAVFRFVEVMNKSVVGCKLVDTGVG